MNTNQVLKHLLVETIFKSRMIDQPQDLDILISETISRLTHAMRHQDRLLNEKEVSQRYPFLSIKQLQNWRYRHQGIKYIKTGRSRNSRVLYRISDIEAFLVNHEQNEPFIERANK